MICPHLDALDTQPEMYRLTSRLNDLAAGCDPEFDSVTDDLERDFAELRLQLPTY